jgi:hypothetical protein
MISCVSTSLIEELHNFMGAILPNSAVPTGTF